jgi:hypothetical protein
MQDKASSYYRIKISTQALLKPDHVALQASYRLEYWAHTLMQDTTSSYSREKNIQHRTWSGLTMWPWKLALDWKFKHDAAPRWGLMSPQGWKMHKKNETYPWTLNALGRLSVPRPPPSSVDLLVQNSKIQISTQKNFNTSPALARACGLESKLQTQNSSSHFDARHSILILMNQNLNTSSAQAYSWGLASKLQTWILNSHSDARHNIFILKRNNIQHRTWSGLTMWPCKQASDWKFKHDVAPTWGLMSP